MSASPPTTPSWLSCFTNNGLPRRRDGPWAWLVLFYLFSCGIVMGGIVFGYGVILPVLMESLKENRERTALVGSLSMGIGFSASPIASKLCERYTCRITFGLGIVMCAVGFMLSSICRSIYLLYLTYSVLTGIGNALAFISVFIVIRQYFDRHYALALGVCSAGGGMGTLAVAPVMQAFLDSSGWQNTFRIISALYVFLLLFVFVIDPNVEEDNYSNNGITTRGEDQPTDESNNSSSNDTGIPRTIVLGILDLSVWKFPEYTICVISIFVSNFGQYSALIHMVKFSEELSISNGSTLFVFFSTATILSRLISGRLCDISFIKPRYVHQVGAILSGLSTIMLGFAQTYIHLAIFAVFYGIADGAFRVTLIILFMNTVDAPRQPSAFGQANMMGSITMSAGPAVAGLMADKMGSYRGAFYMAGTITIFGGCILFVHLCFGRGKDPTQQDDVTKTKDCTGVEIVDHPLSCAGPGVQVDEE